MDLSSIYDSKVSLIVENQVVAKGELVIVNDRYGVKVSEIFEALSQGEYVPPSPQEEIAAEPVGEDAVPQEPTEAPQEGAEEVAPQTQGSEEEFDYSDFDLDEQDI